MKNTFFRTVNKYQKMITCFNSSNKVEFIFKSALFMQKKFLTSSAQVLALREGAVIKHLIPVLPKSCALSVNVPIHYGMSANDFREQVLFNKTLSNAEIIPLFQLLLSMVKNLKHIHNAGIIHNDIKLQNIIVCPEMFSNSDTLHWHANIIDFESSRFILEKDQAYFVRDLGYVAPEILKKETSDYTSDIYSLGICFLRLLYAERFSNKKIHQGNFSDLELNLARFNLNLFAQKELKNLLADMLSVKPKCRPSLNEIEERLNQIYCMSFFHTYQVGTTLIRNMGQKELQLKGMALSGFNFDNYDLFSHHYHQHSANCDLGSVMMKV